MVRNAVLSIGFLCLAGVAVAKPPGLATEPETEFKVLSPLAQEFNQPEDAVTPAVHFAVGVWHGDTAAAATGAGAMLHRPSNGLPEVTISLTIRGDCSSFIRNVWNARFGPAKDRLPKEVYEMAETHRLAGDWAEAKRWYAGIKELYPHSTYARLASERLERYRLLRVLAEAGEEQSEEPPIAEPHGSELLPAPREVTGRERN